MMSYIVYAKQITERKIDETTNNKKYRRLHEKNKSKRS